MILFLIRLFLSGLNKLYVVSLSKVKHRHLASRSVSVHNMYIAKTNQTNLCRTKQSKMRNRCENQNSMNNNNFSVFFSFLSLTATLDRLGTPCCFHRSTPSVSCHGCCPPPPHAVWPMSQLHLETGAPSPHFQAEAALLALLLKGALQCLLPPQNPAASTRPVRLSSTPSVHQIPCLG